MHSWLWAEIWLRLLRRNEWPCPCVFVCCIRAVCMCAKWLICVMIQWWTVCPPLYGGFVKTDKSLLEWALEIAFLASAGSFLRWMVVQRRCCFYCCWRGQRMKAQSVKLSKRSPLGRKVQVCQRKFRPSSQRAVRVWFTLVVCHRLKRQQIRSAYADGARAKHFYRKVQRDPNQTRGGVWFRCCLCRLTSRFALHTLTVRLSLTRFAFATFWPTFRTSENTHTHTHARNEMLGPKNNTFWRAFLEMFFG